MNDSLKNKLENLPGTPGIYQFLNAAGKVIYVGKAKVLKNRVRSYFHSRLDSPKTNALVSKIEDLIIIATDSEIEALVLENNLIKELKPRYNINLKDDKTFPYIKVTNELFPRIYPTRNIIRDGSKYFGPYTDIRSMKASLRMINHIFKIRSCRLDLTEENIEKRKFKICLDYHIKKCDGPCEGLVSVQYYNEMVNEVIKLLKGKTEDLIEELKMKMNLASENMQFEKDRGRIAPHQRRARDQSDGAHARTRGRAGGAFRTEPPAGKKSNGAHRRTADRQGKSRRGEQGENAVP